MGRFKNGRPMVRPHRCDIGDCAERAAVVMVWPGESRAVCRRHVTFALERLYPGARRPASIVPAASCSAVAPFEPWRVTR